MTSDILIDNDRHIFYISLQLSITKVAAKEGKNDNSMMRSSSSNEHDRLDRLDVD